MLLPAAACITVLPLQFAVSVCRSAMAAHAETAFKKRVQDSAVLQDFFRELEAQPFPGDILRENYAEAVARWELLGHTQSTPWMWVMFAELCLVSFLAPTAALRPIPSITVLRSPVVLLCPSWLNVDQQPAAAVRGCFGCH